MKKIALSIFLSVLMSVPCAGAADIYGGTPGYNYEIEVDEATGEEYAVITGFSEEDSQFRTAVIPDKINGIEVRKLAHGAFSKNENLINVVLPESVNIIGSGCFYKDLNLKSINLENVTEIGRGAFEYCAGLADIGNNNTLSFKNIADSPDTGNGNSPSETKIYSAAFRGSGLERVHIDADTMYYKDTVISRDVSISVFMECSNLKFVRFSDRVRAVGINDFNGCKKLDHLCFGPNMKMLQYHAFAGCESLRTAVFYADDVEFEDVEDADTSSYTDMSQYYYRSFEEGRPVFDGCPRLTVIGRAGTNCESYMKKNGVNFIPAIIDNGEPSTVVAHAAQTATVYINGTAVPAYTVNDSVYVGESALRSLGFDMNWDGETRTTTVTKPENVQWSVKLGTNPEPNIVDVVSSDIKFMLDGFPIPALNIGNGESIIDVNAIAEAVLY